MKDPKGIRLTVTRVEEDVLRVAADGTLTIRPEDFDTLVHSPDERAGFGPGRLVLLGTITGEGFGITIERDRRVEAQNVRTAQPGPVRKRARGQR